MDRDGVFADFDDEKVYSTSRKYALDGSTKNFVVDFGKDSAQVAFDLQKIDFEILLKAERPKQRPIRWINIWGPDTQREEVAYIGRQYGFSPRLLAIMVTKPEREDTEGITSDRHGLRQRMRHRDDVEVGTASGNNGPPPLEHYDASHYSIVRQMVNYHAVDIGAKFLCIGANWMHQKRRKSESEDDDHRFEDEGQQRRLYSWLILCDDHTIISLHESQAQINNADDLKLVRANLFSVFSQVSKCHDPPNNPISMQTVRDALGSSDSWGIDGASNLFYYLFDDWRAVYCTVAVFQKKLRGLRKAILLTTSKSSAGPADADIIPNLHMLGGQIRQMQHVYEGYKNLIQRILEPTTKQASGYGDTTPTSPTINRFLQIRGRQGPPLARSAISRFERLGDRLVLLILSETKEFLAEKDALTSTYFNINAQKDSEATARLTRAAALLAKLSVLFLPVSLMTSYFSVNIEDLNGVYTTQDYWYAFAGIMSISFLFLFFLGKLLVDITELLDSWMKKASRGCRRFLGQRLPRNSKNA
ncbi:uncharacterized protein BP5553_01969 [Venustampulla echinocandica]|uniref:ADP-ribosylation factor n=1 Tax=Venustampulla echinocandica TaxID=2656787 RepID=A0A370U2I4_9HELO|nr:uncharacterized protein BP5553_01969 [Venustampulla echinocandica]RDL41990.1 hypothetical protein BP5553_01969 [Venustampulla echinocandica]